MKILISDPISTTGMQILKNANFTILDYQKKNIDVEILPEIDGWIIRSGTEVNQNYLKKAKKLQVIGRAGVGVDNCIIDCDGPEIPIMEGSSTKFVFLIQAAGIVEQNAVKKFVYVTKSVQVQRDDAVARIKPYDGL